MKRRPVLVGLYALLACALCFALIPSLGQAAEDGEVASAGETTTVETPAELTPAEETPTSDTQNLGEDIEAVSDQQQDEDSEDEGAEEVSSSDLEEQGTNDTTDVAEKKEETQDAQETPVSDVAPESSSAVDAQLGGVSAPTVTYRVHGQTYGWQGWKSNGSLAGTTGLYKRLEAIEIGVKVPGVSGGIAYRVHGQTYGWQGWKPDGQTAGTTGKSKRLEAIEIKLTGDLANKYDVWYRVHGQTYGWQGWKRNGQLAGTTGQYKRLEAIEIKLTRKGSSSVIPVAGAMVNYNVHAQTYGWLGTSVDGELAGTTGEYKRLEAINIKLGSQLNGGITYRVHGQTYGWQGWKSDGQTAGTTGMSKRLEAIQIKLTGDAAKKYSVWYRVHGQTYGWQGWKSDGELAGTTGQYKRLEAIEIRILEKGMSLNTPRSSSLIYIDAGHGKSGSSGYDPGSSGSGYEEANLTKELVNKIVYYARNSYGLNVYSNIDCDVPYTQRQQHASSVGATSFLSIHFNWGSGGATGYESYIYAPYGQYTGKAAAGSDTLQSIMHAHLKKALPQLVDRGKRTEAFAVTNGAKTGIPATLLEVCFISNASDMKYYQQQKETVAKELAAGLYEAYQRGF